MVQGVQSLGSPRRVIFIRRPHSPGRQGEETPAHDDDRRKRDLADRAVLRCGAAACPCCQDITTGMDGLRSPRLHGRLPPGDSEIEEVIEDIRYRCRSVGGKQRSEAVPILRASRKHHPRRGSDSPARFRGEEIDRYGFLWSLNTVQKQGRIRQHGLQTTVARAV